MKKLLILILFFGIQFSYISCSKDSDANEEQSLPAETFLNVSYGSNAQEKYDLYLPENRSAERTKVIVLVHGGGWIEGDKADMDFLIPYIKLRHPDHAIVNINYVLADANTPAFPNQFLNLDAVINKLTSEKDELHILPQFALVGVSAGAHISLMYDYVYDTDDQVKIVGDIVGPTDFTDPFYSDNPNFPVLMAALVDESAYPAGTNYAEVLSPAFQVSNASSPTLLFYGNADPLVPLSNATTLNSALNIAQIDHTLNVYEGGHGDWSNVDIENMKAQISTYVDMYLEVN
ncbi:alpha/beta hydrolase [Aequorivita todarodis]|uniref:alpha/beta hydrolase n=1 Tax=Aequorivita todarodis TaxID=2036821 RepID=UPI0023507D41|nr:alpha/beta hydrolase [Aequorivita todarodis]MDC8000019.1 alpha/beta hydrolase [Aequorivita todarodis]